MGQPERINIDWEVSPKSCSMLALFAVYREVIYQDVLLAARRWQSIQ